MDKKMNDRSVEVILSSQIGYERVAMACSACFAKMFGCPPERIEDLKTVVSEAAINAMQHGNKGRPEAKVIVSLVYKDNAINVSVIDEGDGITDLPPKPNIELIMDNLAAPIGFGVFLIEQLSDQVEFNEVTAKGHAVKMIINIK